MVITLDADSVMPEEPKGVKQKSHSGAVLLIEKDLGIGEARMVDDGEVKYSQPISGCCPGRCDRW